MEKIFMNMENSKTNKAHKFVLNLLHRLDLNLKLKFDNRPNVNDEFELSDGSYSVSDIVIIWSIS